MIEVLWYIGAWVFLAAGAGFTIAALFYCENSRLWWETMLIGLGFLILGFACIYFGTHVAQ